MDTHTPGSLGIMSKLWAVSRNGPIYNINSKRTKLDSKQHGMAGIATLPIARLKAVSVQ